VISPQCVHTVVLWRVTVYSSVGINNVSEKNTASIVRVESLIVLNTQAVNSGLYREVLGSNLVRDTGYPD
jgi:hypothetical protein